MCYLICVALQKTISKDNCFVSLQIIISNFELIYINSIHMKTQLAIFSIFICFSGCKIPNSAYPIESYWFDIIEKSYKKELEEIQLYPYDTKIEVSGNENRIINKQDNKVIIYLLPFEKISIQEKLLTEDYYQRVRHLYKTRQDFIREYYTIFKTCLTLSNLVIYGINSTSDEVSNKDIFLFTITFLKKHQELGINIDRLREVYNNISEYIKTTTKTDFDYLHDEKEIHDAILAFRLADTKNFDEIKKELSNTNFSK